MWSLFSKNRKNFGKQLRPKRIEDVILTPKKRQLSFKEKAWQIELSARRIKRFFQNNKIRLAYIFSILIIISGILGYFLISQADVISFYPTSCLGGWQNPQNAQGKPELVQDAQPEEFNEANSAVLKNIISQIFCGNFEGEIPEDSQPKKVLLKFSWAVKTEEQILTNEENLTTSTLIEIIEATSTEGLISTSTPEIIPEEESTSSPMSFWRRVIPLALAEETSTSTEETVMEVNSTSSLIEPPEDTQIPTSTLEETIIPPTPEPFLEIFYTLDGANWQSLAKINQENWKNLELEIPNFNWEDISKIQISIQSLSPVDFIPVVYLDALWLEVEYENLNSVLPFFSELSPEMETLEQPPADLPDTIDETKKIIPKTQPKLILKIFDEQAKHKCFIEPFSQQITEGASANYKISLKPSSPDRPYQLILGDLPSGVEANFNKSLSGPTVPATISLILTAGPNVQNGSFNIAIIYRETQENNEILSNFCQLNLIIK